jgi:hypothetical protein
MDVEAGYLGRLAPNEGLVGGVRCHRQMMLSSNALAAITPRNLDPKFIGFSS